MTDKDSLLSINYKITHIEQFLVNLNHDMESLASEEENWKDEKQEWDETAHSYLRKVESKIRSQIKSIQKQLAFRSSTNQNLISQVDLKLTNIYNIQKQSQYLMKDLHKRLDRLELSLGN